MHTTVDAWISFYLIFDSRYFHYACVSPGKKLQLPGSIITRHSYFHFRLPFAAWKYKDFSDEFGKKRRQKKFWILRRIHLYSSRELIENKHIKCILMQKCIFKTKEVSLWVSFTSLDMIVFTTLSCILWFYQNQMFWFFLNSPWKHCLT